MTCTLLAVARASVTGKVRVRVQQRRDAGADWDYSETRSKLSAFGGPMECANLIRTFLFPIIHPNFLLVFSSTQIDELLAAMLTYSMIISIVCPSKVDDSVNKKCKGLLFSHDYVTYYNEWEMGKYYKPFLNNNTEQANIIRMLN